MIPRIEDTRSRAEIAGTVQLSGEWRTADGEDQSRLEAGTSWLVACLLKHSE